MEKVLYTVTKLGRNPVTRSGLGYISKEDLVMLWKSAEDKPFIKVFDDCLKQCHRIAGTDNEFKGAFWELFEHEGRPVEVNYSIYYKVV